MVNKRKFNQPGVVLIIEGVWNSGKTTLARSIEEKYGSIFLEEPNHIKSGFGDKNMAEVTEWYLSAHNRNTQDAETIAFNKKNVVIERSMLSSIIFRELVLEEDIKVPLKCFEENLKKINKSLGQKVSIVYLNIRDMESAIAQVKKNKYLGLKKSTNKEFLKGLDMLLRNHLEELDQKNLINLIKYVSFDHLKDTLNNIYD